MQPEELDLTVQYYRSEHLDATPSLTQDVLDNANKLVLSVTREVKWYNPPFRSSTSFAIGEHCFQWSRQIPDVENNADLCSNRNIAEWQDDVAAGDDELWALADLEDFDHSRLHRLLEPQPSASNYALAADDLSSTVSDLTSMAAGQKRSADRDFGALTTQANPGKRPKLEESPLRDVIPEIRFFSACPTTDDPNYKPPSAKLHFFPIPPHTLASAMEYMKDPYARLRWIIPVRGRLQWDGATAASMLAFSHDAGSPVSDDELPYVHSDSSGSELVWTRDALNDLWDTLKTLRDSGRFGPLSLSFHAVSPATLANSMEQYSYIGSHKQTTISMSTSMSSDTPLDDPSLRSTGSPLRAVDHIKVYHDAKYTQTLRVVLRSWSYKRAGQKIRLLKEAKLVLLDELSQGLVIC